MNKVFGNSPGWMCFSQKRQLRLAEQERFSADFLHTVAIGYSDAGTVGLRSAREMKAVRQLLSRNRSRFSTVTLLGVSDEVLRIYDCGFGRNLSLRSINSVVDWYRDELRQIRAYAAHIAPRRLRHLIAAAFDDAIRRLAHMVDHAA